MEERTQNVTERFLRQESEEILKLNDDGTTSLIRRGGRFLVKKEVSPEAGIIYITIKTLIDDGRLKNVPKIISVLKNGGGWCVTEEFIGGETVADMLKRGESFSAGEVGSIVEKLCESLNVIHKSGIVHRDLSPHNIIIAMGQPYIVDFGISRRIKEGVPADTQLLGTPGFAAPEQYGFSQSDERTDIYALGVLMDAMLKNGSETGDEVKKVRRIIEVCTEIDPRRRYSSAERLRAALTGKKYFKRTIKRDILRLLPWFF